MIRGKHVHPIEAQRTAAGRHLLSMTLIVIAACGDDDDTQATTAEAGATTTAAGETETTTAASGGGGGGDTTETTEGGTDKPAGATSAGERASEDPATRSRAARWCTGRGRHGQPVGALQARARRAARDVLKAVSDALFTMTRTASRCRCSSRPSNTTPTTREWTMHVRDGIKFHDGKPLDGAAVKFNIDTCRASPLTASAYRRSSASRPRAKTSRCSREGPWVALPYVLLDQGTCAFMFSPKWLGSLAERAAAHRGLGGLRRRVGGHASDRRRRSSRSAWAPSSTSRTPRATATPSWPSATPTTGGGPNGITAEDLPYLDKIEFVVAVDEDGRQLRALGRLRRRW